MILWPFFLIILTLFSVDLFLLLCCQSRKVPLAFVVKLVWWCRILFNFLLSGKLLISPSNLKDSLVGWNILGCRFFPFITLNMSCHSHLACRVSVEKSADSLMGVPFYVTCHFSLVAFNILSLSLILSVWLPCISVCSSLGSSCLGLSVLLGLDWLSPFPC